MKYKDLNEDGKIDNYDHCYQQNTTLPEIYYGFSLGLNYKNWGLKANFQGVAHYSVWNTLASVYRPLYGNDKKYIQVLFGEPLDGNYSECPLSTFDDPFQ